MVQKVILCRLIWAEKYDSKSEKMFAGNMGYPAEHGVGIEQLNFANDAGRARGFVENRSHNLDIGKIGASPDAQSVDGITVIFCAVDPLEMRLRVVGWYEDATVFRGLQKSRRGTIRGNWQYYFDCAIDDAHLIPATTRDLEVPRKMRITDQGFIGQRNVFYPIGNPNYERFLESFYLLQRGVKVPADVERDNEEYQEGQRAFRESSFMARNSKLVRDAKSHHGVTCQACGFNFERKYGELGKGYAEVHHKRPMADGGERTTTVKDVDVLCANCHRMVHRKKTPLSLSELREILANVS